MDKKSKIFFLVFGFLIVGSVSFTYYRIMIRHDYIVTSQIDCDPETEQCFIWECDPESSEEGEACTGDPEEDIWYYKVAQRNAKNIPDCDPEEDENCDPWACNSGEKDCGETFCDEQTSEEQGFPCSDPEQYLLDNPPEEEGEDTETKDSIDLPDISPQNNQPHLFPTGSAGDGSETAEKAASQDTAETVPETPQGEQIK